MNSQTLADAACTIALRSAQLYLTQHSLKATNLALSECLKAHVKAALPAALHDAKSAFDCNMVQVGVSTFTATISLAGIEAAKEAGMPIPIIGQSMDDAMLQAITQPSSR